MEKLAGLIVFILFITAAGCLGQSYYLPPSLKGAPQKDLVIIDQHPRYYSIRNIDGRAMDTQEGDVIHLKPGQHHFRISTAYYEDKWKRSSYNAPVRIGGTAVTYNLPYKVREWKYIISEGGVYLKPGRYKLHMLTAYLSNEEKSFIPPALQSRPKRDLAFISTNSFHAPKGKGFTTYKVKEINQSQVPRKASGVFCNPGKISIAFTQQLQDKFTFKDGKYLWEIDETQLISGELRLEAGLHDLADIVPRIKVKKAEPVK